MRLAPSTLLLVALTACSAGTPMTLDPGASGTPTVAVSEGLLSGTVERGVAVFRGIPYAAAPVGDGRFRAPAPPKSWSGTRAADRLGKNCVQDQIYSDIDPFAAGISEDCLYLNVYTAGTGGSPKPVMVWVHGGGYTAGFGAEGRHDGTRLAQKGAVVVTLNYRLGVFGFLAHPALAAESPVGASGNYGILDQVAALKWVQRNIARFGGDPSRVTIFGESAGGSSVGALIATPLAKGLFHRGILQSGNAIGGARLRDSAYAEGRRFAATIGITGSDAAAAARLRAIPTDSLMRASRPRNATGGFTNAISSRLVRDGLVLPLSVDSALHLGRANLVPIIVGATRDEGDNAYATARSFARLTTAKGKDAYLYLFSRVGDDSVNRRRGAYHSADITFTFGLPKPIMESAGRTAYDSTLAETMTDYFVAFAATGNPNTAPAKGNRAFWPIYDSKTDAYMELGPESVARSNLRRAVYDSLDVLGRSRGDVRP